MTTSLTSDELQTLIKYPFKDPNWQTKFIIGSLLMIASYIIPLVPSIFVYGYCARIMARIIVEKGEPYLPEWDDWGKLFTDGLKLIGVALLYSLPFLLFFCAGYGLFFAMIAGAETISAEPSQIPEEMPPVETLLPLAGMAVWLITFGLSMVGFLLVGLILPVAISHVIATGEFAAAFRVREWWPIFRANIAGFLITYLLVLGGWMALSFVMQILYLTIILCCLLPFIMAAVGLYTMIIGSVLFANAYRTGVDNLAAQPASAQAA